MLGVPICPKEYYENKNMKIKIIIVVRENKCEKNNISHFLCSLRTLS